MARFRVGTFWVGAGHGWKSGDVVSISSVVGDDVDFTVIIDSDGLGMAGKSATHRKSLFLDCFSPVNPTHKISRFYA